MKCNGNTEECRVWGNRRCTMWGTGGARVAECREVVGVEDFGMKVRYNAGTEEYWDAGGAE